MKMSGSRQIAAPQAEVWAKLNDVDVLKRCIPGCESLEKSGENDLKSTVAVKIGPMSVRFNGAVTLADLVPPTSYRISGKGQGGPAGFASGGANVNLEAKDGGTLLSYDVDATVGGKIAQLGARLIDASAAHLANQFFDRFAAEMTPAATAAAEVAPSPSPAQPAAAATARATPPRSAAPSDPTPGPSRASAGPGTAMPSPAKSGKVWIWAATAAGLGLLALYWLLRQPFS